MDRPQLILRLRIAASVFFAVVTVALCVLWVRSYWRWDSVSAGLTDTTYYVIDSAQGRCNGGIAFISPGQETPFELDVFELEGNDPVFDASNSILGFELWDFGDDFDAVGGCVPHWFFVAIAIAFTATPWLGARFSLRALLVTTTLVAVVLGLGVWPAV